MSAPSSPAAAAPRRFDPDGPVVLEVDHLAARYEELVVLQDVSFRLHQGEILVVIGASGCGKSTLVRCLIGLHRPSAGRILLLGQDVEAISPEQLDRLRRSFGVSFQGAALLNSLTVGENVSLPLREHTRLDPATIRIMTRLKLEQVGLGGTEDLMPAELSGGMRKRAGIARALAMEPKMLFLDEPSAGLDPITAAGLDELLLRLRSALGISIVVVTHEMASAYLIADRIMLLHLGVVRFAGTAAELKLSTDVHVRQFLERRPDPDVRGGESLVQELMR